MSVQGEVCSVEAQVATDERRHLPEATTGERPETVPEDAVVDQQQVGAGGHGRLDDLLRGVDRGREVAHLRRTGDLQPVDRTVVVGVRVDGEELLQILEDGF